MAHKRFGRVATVRQDPAVEMAPPDGSTGAPPTLRVIDGHELVERLLAA